VTTLEGIRDEAAVLRGRRYRRIGLVAILVVVLSGLTGLLGIRSTTPTIASKPDVLWVADFI
jgi:hypothetical protein